MTHSPASGRRGRKVGQPAVATAAVLVLVLALLPAGILPNVRSDSSLSGVAAQEEPVPFGDVIVVLKDRHRDPRDEARAAGVNPRRVYRRALNAFAATLTQAQAERLARSNRVAYISPDLPVSAASQSIPTGVKRVGGDTNPVAGIDGVDDRVDADIAILDTGIDPSTGELNVAGGVDCDGVDTGDWQDENGHGTHVAGTIGALDNSEGVVGVAPGARLWSVRVLNSTGGGSTSALLCGLDWVVEQVQTGQPIDVVNMSLTGSGADGDCDTTALHEAICNVVAAGVPVVVAAGNGPGGVGRDASTTTPATYDEVIAVSAFNDFNGLPGGGATKPSNCSTSSTVDDAFATYSNDGPDVDITAPGTCIASLALGGGLAYRSGTSMAAPHVTGAVALFKSINHDALPSVVRSWLLSQASQPQSSEVGITGDTDGVAEPVLAIGNLAIPKEAYDFVGSGHSQNSLPPTLVWDDNESTFWKTNVSTPPNSAYVYVDLGGVKPVATVRWVFAQANIADSMKIQVSDDATAWTTISTQSNAPLGIWQEFETSVDARYVRFLFWNPNFDVQVGGLAEVQVLPPGASSSETTPSPTPTPTNTVTATPTKTPTSSPTGTATPEPTYQITASSRSTNSLPASVVWDGDLATFWKSIASSPPSSAWVYVSLGSSKPIAKIKWVFGQTGIADSMKIQVSTDKINWTTVATKGNAPVGLWRTQPVTVTARYIRFYFDNPNGDAQLGGLAEVQIVPPAAPTPTPTKTPTRTPTPSPTTTPTSTSTPTPSPTATATNTAEASPTETPTDTPTETPTGESTIQSAGDDGDGSPVAQDTVAASEADAPYRVVRTSHTGDSNSGTVLLDDDPTTYWLAEVSDSSSEATVTLDLGEAKPIGTIRWLFAVGEFADGMRIEVAHGRRDWTTLTEPGNAEVGDWQEFTPAVPVTARYVRFTFVKTGDSDHVGGLAEVEVWP